MNKVSIVIVNWNTGDLLAQCLTSIRSLPEYELIRYIVVVDNASRDESIRQLASCNLPESFIILKQDNNLGFSKATNLGIECVHQHGGAGDHILLLNPDTEIKPNAIRNMLNAFDANTRAAIVGPRLIGADGNTQASVRSFPTTPVFKLLFLKMHRLFSWLPLWKRYMMASFDYSKEQSVDQVMGAAFLIRNTALRELGLLDELFWIWFEEVDYCKRAHNAHWKVIYTPSAEVVHYGGVSFGQLVGIKKTKPFLDSSIVYAKKHLSSLSYIYLKALYPVAYLIAMLASVAHIHQQKKHVPPVVVYSIFTAAIAIFLALFMSVQLGMGAIAFALIGWWVWRYPEEGFLLLLVLSPFLPLLKVTQTLGNATLIKDVIIFALAAKTFFVPLIEKTLPYRRNILLAPMIALSTWAVIETFMAPSHTLAALRLRDIVLYMILYMGVLYLPHSKKIMRNRLLYFSASVITVIILGFIQLHSFPDSTVLRFDPVRQIWIPRMGSTFGHPTPFAEFLVTAEMLCIGYALVGYKNKKALIAMAILFLTTLPALYYTYTRASWIALVIGIAAIGVCVLFMRMRSGKKRLTISWKYIAIAMIVLALGLGGLFRFTHIGTFLQTSFDPTYASNADRFKFIIQLIAQTSNADAIFGKGLGSSITQTNIATDVSAIDIASGASRSIQLSQDATLVDNQYLKTFIEMGVIGVVFTLWLFWRFLIASYSLGKTSSHISRMLGIAGIGFLAAFMIQALFVDIFDVYPTNAIFWVIAALISQAKLKNN